MKTSQVYIIAEAGSNWIIGGKKENRELGKRMIELAKEAGANAVKFQTFRAKNVYPRNSGTPSYMRERGEEETIFETFQRLEMEYEFVEFFYHYAKRCGIDFMTSFFSKEDFSMVDPFVDRHKIASYEISHPYLIDLAAASQKPTYLSTGGATMEEIGWAVDLFRAKGGGELTLMHCTLSYPTPPEEMNVRALSHLLTSFALPIGLSDHSREVFTAPLLAVALGATVIEKHFTLHNSLPGPDHLFAITDRELKELVLKIRLAEEMVGDGVKRVQPSEREMRNFGQRRLQMTTSLPKGGIFAEGENYAILRPGSEKGGVHPRYIAQLQGKRATRGLTMGEGILEGDWK